LAGLALIFAASAQTLQQAQALWKDFKYTEANRSLQETGGEVPG
jgi:hypothetical protein